MFFCIFKNFFIHISLPFLAVLSFFADNGLRFRLFFVFAFIHECAHLSTALLLGGKLHRLYVMPYGFELKIGGMSFHNEFFIILAGPAASFLLMISGYFLNMPMLARINFIILVLNLLPALPLDGGRLLRITLWKVLGFYKGNRIMRFMGIIIPLLLTFYSFWHFSGWLLTISALIFITSQRNLEVLSPLAYKKNPTVTRVKLFTVSRQTKLCDAVKFFSPYYYTVFLVKEKQEMIYEKDIISYCSRFGLGGLIVDLCRYYEADSGGLGTKP